MHVKLLQVVAFFSIVLMVYTSAYKSWIRLSYEINKLEIIEKFCINKEEKAFTCDGKCHLKTQLEEVEDSQPFSKEQIVEESNIVLFINKVQKEKFSKERILKSYISGYKNSYSFLHSNTIFHPPQT